MNLVFYSGGQSPANHKLHQNVYRLARKKKKKGPLLITYIPFCADGAAPFFHRFCRRFRSNGFERFYTVSFDTNPLREEIDVALRSDVIYLAGGNTFYFLKHLRKSGVEPLLAAFARRGGVLAGLSAGGLILSPTIKSAGDPLLDPDENEVGLKNLNALGLVDFEFAPHFEFTPRSYHAHLSYSKKTKHPVMAVPDGSGLVVENGVTRVIGEAVYLHQGRAIEFKSNS